jgi:glycosyltransferase involved in cell wall biosynthesis
LKLSIIIPIYNEFNNIDEVINRINAVRLPKAVSGLQIILVDDGSVDGTTAKLEKYKDEKTMVVHESRINFGKGTATRIGLTYVTGDLVLIQDADLEYDPNDYPTLLEPVLDQGAEIVFGSRFLGKTSRLEGMALKNWFINMFLRTMTNVLYGSRITDEATAYKLFKTSILKEINLKSKRFEFCPEVTAKVLKRGYKIHEVPISYKGRTVEEGKKIKWQDGIEAIWTLLKYRFVN